MGSALQSICIFALVGGILAMMADGIVPLVILATLQSMQVVISIASRLPQIIQNFKNGSTGQLSSITLFLFFAGSLARVFTSLQEAPDLILIVSAGVAAFFNSLLFLQVIIYSGVKKKPIVCCKVNEESKKVD